MGSVSDRNVKVEGLVHEPREHDKKHVVVEQSKHLTHVLAEFDLTQTDYDNQLGNAHSNAQILVYRSRDRFGS